MNMNGNGNGNRQNINYMNGNGNDNDNDNNNSNINDGMSKYNLAQLCVSSRSKCGYCHGERACVLQSNNNNNNNDHNIIMKNNDNMNDSPKEEEEIISSENSSKCYGSLFLLLQSHDYEKLLNLGWRRSGKHLYKPDNFLSCCPALSIRLNTNHFIKSKSQRKVWNKVMNYFNHSNNDKQSKQQSKHDTKGKKKTTNNENDKEYENTLLKPIINEITNITIEVLQDILLNHATNSTITLPILFIKDIMNKCPYKFKKNYNDQDDYNYDYIIVSSVCTAILGKYPTIYFPNNKLKLLHDVARNINKHIQSHDHTNLSNIKSIVITSHDKSLQIQLHVTIHKNTLNNTNVPMEISTFNDNNTATATSTTAKQRASSKQQFKMNINEPKQNQQSHNNNPTQNKTNNNNKLIIKLIPSRVSAKDPEVHRLYCKYQHAIHGDIDPYTTSTSTSSNNANLPTQSQKTNHLQISSFESFYKFLGDTPLPYPNYNTKNQSNDKTNNDKDGYDINVPYGSYHQQYRDTTNNNKLIAVGVVDILPTCLSSVYSFYDPYYTKLNLGTYTALYEISWVQKHSTINYYYLGYYIHSCIKMKYKSNFKPSELLCPTHNVWVNFDYAISLILLNSPIQHCSTLYQPKDAKKNNHTKNNNYSYGNKELIINSMLLEIGTPTTSSSSSSTTAITATNNNPEDDQTNNNTTNNNTALSIIEDDPPINISNVLSNCVPVSHVNAYYRNVIDPLLEEFVDNIGMDVSQHCIIQM